MVQSIDRIRSLESAKDFNYWPEASNKWTFDLRLGFSARRLLVGVQWLLHLVEVIAGPGDEEMAFLLNPYNLRSRIDHFVASGRNRGNGRIVGILLDWIVIRDFIHKVMKSNWDELETRCRSFALPRGFVRWARYME